MTEPIDTSAMAKRAVAEADALLAPVDSDSSGSGIALELEHTDEYNYAEQMLSVTNWAARYEEGVCLASGAYGRPLVLPPRELEAERDEATKVLTQRIDHGNECESNSPSHLRALVWVGDAAIRLAKAHLAVADSVWPNAAEEAKTLIGPNHGLYPPILDPMELPWRPEWVPSLELPA